MLIAENCSISQPKHPYKMMQANSELALNGLSLKYHGASSLRSLHDQAHYTVSTSSTKVKQEPEAEAGEAGDYVSHETPCLCDEDNEVKVKVSGRRWMSRDRILQTTVLYSGVFFLGLQWGVIGPSLPDIEQLTGGTTTYIALILTARNVASLVGSALAGFLIDRYNNWLLLGAAEVLLGLMFALAPWSHELVLLTLCLIPSGLAAGFYDTGVNVAVLRVWISNPGPWIQAMECIDAIGSFVAPLIAQPFLSRKTSDSSDDAQLVNVTLVAGVDMVPTSDNPGYILEHPSSTAANYTLNTTMTAPGNSSDVYYEVSRVGYAYLIVGILLMFCALVHFFIFCRESCSVRLVKGSCADSGLSRERKEHPRERKIRLLILPLLFAICFAYYALETGYAHYLMMFCVKYLNWTKDQGVALTSAFWAAYTLGTAIGIVIIKYVLPRTLLVFDVTLCVISQVTLVCFVDYHPAVIWVCTIAVGFSVSTIFASVFSWTQKNIGISGKVNALLMVGMAAGEMTSPAIIGILIDKSGAISWLYCMVAASCLCMITYLQMHLLANELKATRRKYHEHSPATSTTSEHLPEIKISEHIECEKSLIDKP